MDLGYIADQLDNFKTGLEAVITLTGAPEKLSKFVNADWSGLIEAFSSK